ncbi:MAG: CoB--CoM heterodisulfide reductase iron-sulfur subunit B family protein [Nitrospirota bacterium]
MRYAFYPGCSAKGTCPELYQSTIKLAKRLEIELAELTSASCCGAGVIAEADPILALAINARTFAQAERMGVDIIMTICGTCQGVMYEANKRLKEDEKLLEEVNRIIEKDGGGRYNLGVEIKHLQWIMTDGIMLERLRETMKTSSLHGIKIAPFYGCHILRPSVELGFDDPEKPESLKKIIEALEGIYIEYPGMLKCCGFPIILENEDIALQMIGKNLLEAKDRGADIVVTPCPLCHMNLDIYQKRAEKRMGIMLDLPILHLSQMLCMVSGLEDQAGLQL